MRSRRWFIVIIIAIGVIVNYLDRTNMSIATKPMSQDFHLTAGQMGIVLSAFGWSYALLQLPVGTLLDRIGVKWVVRLGTSIWTLACLLTAVASGLGLVLLSRVLLGVGEAPYFPAATKATGYWFPKSERARAISIFDSQSKLANAIGSPLIALVITQWGWRGAFFFTSALSLLYFIAFWEFYRNPSEDPGLTEEEKRYISEGGAQQEGEAELGVWRSLGYLLQHRKVWAVFIGFAAYAYSWFMFLTWLPGYLETQMHMSVLATGWYAAIPWLVGFLTETLIGGWAIDWLVRRGADPTRVRKTFLVGGLLLGLSVLGAVFTHDARVAITWISIALGGLVITSSIAYSIPTFIAPRGTVGTLTGFLTFGNNSMGIVAPIVTGFIVQATGSFVSAFVVAAVILFIGLFAYAVLLTDLEPIAPPTQSLAAVQAGVDRVNR